MAKGTKYPSRTREGLVLRQRTCGDADAIVSLFSQQEGIQGFFAKSLRKPQAKLQGILQPVHQVEITFVQGRGLPIVTGASTLESFSWVMNDPQKTWVVQYVGQSLCRLLPEGEPAPDLYAFFLKHLQEAEGLAAPILFLNLEWGIVDRLGYQIDFSSCSHCQRTTSACPELAYLEEGGGLVCQICCQDADSSIAIDEDLFRFMTHLGTEHFQTLEAIRLTHNQFQRVSRISRQRWEGMGFGQAYGRDTLFEVLDQSYIDK